MTKKEIKQAIKDGWVIALRDNPKHIMAIDLFGDLVVDSLKSEEGYPRKATLGDKRRAYHYVKRNN